MSISKKLQEMKQQKAEENKLAGQKFLEENKKRPEVTTLDSGLQYEIIKEGQESSAKPTFTSSVTCHYKGYTIDNKVFDSSYERGRPATFPLNQVIAGWTEGLQLMTAGSVYRFFIPYDLGYGDRQVGTDIAPYSTLIFDVELLGF